MEYRKRQQGKIKEMSKKASLMFKEFRKDDRLLEDLNDLIWPELDEIQKQSKRRVVRSQRFDLLSILDY